MPHTPYLEALVKDLQKRHVVTEALSAAFLAVPRHLFLPDLSLEHAYADQAIPVKRGSDESVISSSSQPTMMALMLRQLHLHSGHNVLEIGAGTGYNAALMQHLVGKNGKVTSVELDHDLAKQASSNLHRAGFANVNVVEADGVMGYGPRAAYDRIIATAGVWDVPLAWFKQLKQNGVLVAPIWVDGMQVSAAFTRQSDGTWYSQHNVLCGFVPLRGAGAGPHMQKQVHTSGLFLSADTVETLDTAALHLLLSSDHEQCYLTSPLDDAALWGGLMPYLALHTPRGMQFFTYTIGSTQKAYGMEGSGFGLLAQGSASFVRLGEGAGRVDCYASSDVFVALDQAAQTWAAARPTMQNLALRLVPLDQTKPTQGQVYTRRDHYLQVTM
jgi:protein-L-isoaspartate(D-aspartate) O-methyltransferase